MFGSEVIEKVFESLSLTMQKLTEILGKHSDAIRNLDERGRNTESNINLIAEFTKKNAATITATPWEVSNLNLAYEKLVVMIQKQESQIGRLEEIIAKSVAANFKANEETKQNLNTLISAMVKTHENVSLQSQVSTEFFTRLGEEYPKTKNVIEYLLLSTTSDSGKKSVKQS